MSPLCLIRNRGNGKTMETTMFCSVGGGGVNTGMIVRGCIGIGRSSPSLFTDEAPISFGNFLLSCRVCAGPAEEHHVGFPGCVYVSMYIYIYIPTALYVISVYGRAYLV